MEQAAGKGVIVNLLRDDKICLARQKKKISKGKLKGYGGGIEGDETAPEAAQRELRDESSVEIELADLIHAGTVTFHNTKESGAMYEIECDVFFVEKFSGEPRESDEMGPPAWFSSTGIPYDHMMAGDVAWLPAIVTGHRANINIFYGPKHEKMIKSVVITPLHNPSFWKFEPRK